MSIRDKIFAANDIRTEVVDIPEWGVKVELRGKSVEQQWKLIEKCRRPDGSIDSELLSVETILACSYDPDTGERVFEDADRDMLRKKASGPFQKLLAAANRVAGLEDEATVVANLDEAQDADSSS